MVSLDQLAASVPKPVLEVCQVLRDAGHRGFAVGGAVRDVLLGRHPGDWDVTTDALPEVVNKLFAKTIPTGIEHGTITALVGRGRNRMAIEITTFRGEGTYSDARRPDSVVFGVSLEKDLARRDFVINALAFDPIDRVLIDPFDGIGDLKDQLIRAVGVPLERFTEDGLRVMRAVRLVSTLNFGLEHQTQDALGGALDSLAKVAKERVRVELLKLLAGPGRQQALEIAWQHGVLQVALPLTGEIDWTRALKRVVGVDADEPIVRLAALLLDAPLPAVERGLRELTLSNPERTHILALHRGATINETHGDPALRFILGQVGRDRCPNLIKIWQASGHEDRAERADRMICAGDALVTSELAVGGGDVIAELDLKPSPLVGRVMAHLLAEVHRDPATNNREILLRLARTFVANTPEYELNS